MTALTARQSIFVKIVSNRYLASKQTNKPFMFGTFSEQLRKKVFATL